MRDFFDSIAITLMVVFWMLICAVAVPIGLLAAAVWGPVEGIVNTCRNVCRLRDGK